jgi:V8-like Glu-specific endopeptidase
LQTIKVGSCFSSSRKLVSTTTAKTKKPLFTIHPDYLKYTDQSPYDAAVITFNNDVTIMREGLNFQYGSQSFEIGNHYGYASLGSYDEDTLLGSIINITGYPGTVRFSRDNLNMYTMKGCVKKVLSSDTLLYEVDTSTGQSGSGIWRDVTDSNDVEIVGIHSEEYTAGYNGGVMLNDNMIQFLSSHLKQHDSVWHAASGLP